MILYKFPRLAKFSIYYEFHIRREDIKIIFLVYLFFSKNQTKNYKHFYGAANKIFSSSFFFEYI